MAEEIEEMVDGKAVWSSAEVNDLPDSAFLYIEKGGTKDETGKTTPRSLRHFPYKDAEGKVDLPHLRNAIARIPQSNAPGLDKEALQARAQALLAKQQPKSVDDVIEIGSSVKMLADGRYSGYLVRFGDTEHVDLEGEYFSKDTDFGLDEDTKTAIYYHHGQDAVLGKRVLGKGVLLKDDTGIWVEGQLALRDRWEHAVREMGLQGKLNWSSGTAGHLVERESQGKATWIKRWPLGLDASMTPTPAEPGAILTMKSYQALDTPALKGFVLEDAAEAVVGTEESKSVKSAPAAPGQQSKVKRSDTMRTLKTFESGGRFYVYALDEGEDPMGRFPVKSFDTNQEAEDYIADERKPEHIKLMEMALEHQSKAFEDMFKRLTVNQGERKGVAFSSQAEEDKADGFAKFLMAVIKGDQQALDNMGGTKTLSETTGPAGAYLVPTPLLPDFIQLGGENEIVYPRADVQQVNGPVALPGLSTAGSTAGRSNFYGGMYAEWTESGHQKADQEIEFTKIELHPWELSGYVPVYDQLLRRAVINLPNLLNGLFREATAFYRDESFLDGTGAGQPLGMIVSPGTFVQTRQTAGTITYLDLVRMKGHLLPASWRNAHWIFSISCYEALITLQNPLGMYIWQESARDGEPSTILGLPYVFTEKTPILGSRGDVLLADERFYYIADEMKLSVAKSEHVLFLQNQTVFKFFLTVDGQEKLHAPIFLKDGVTQVSPFVVLGQGGATT